MKQKEILLLVTSFFIIVIFWVGFSIYHSSVNSTISEKINTTISPINPDFDLGTVNKIKARKEYSPLFEMELAKEEPSVSTSAGEISDNINEEELN